VTRDRERKEIERESEVRKSERVRERDYCR
jgi:hypothetical protein